ncbi:MAG: DUF2490 domain-containing protein [Chitinophagales bacterium]
MLKQPKPMMTMMIKKLLLAFYLVIIIFSTQLSAQTTDGAGWLNAGISFNIIEDLTCDISEEARYNFSVAELYQLNSDVALDYKITKKIKVGADYRFSIRPEKNINRVGASINLREGFNDLDIGFRSKVQYSFTPDAQEGSAWRNKVSVKYKINKDFTPFISGELFYSFETGLHQFDDYRLEGGIGYSPTKHHDIKAAYLYDKEFQVNDPETLHIFALGYVYSF